MRAMARVRRGMRGDSNNAVIHPLTLTYHAPAKQATDCRRPGHIAFNCGKVGLPVCGNQRPRATRVEK